MEFHIPDRSYNQIAYTCCHSRTQKPFLVRAAQKKNNKKTTKEQKNPPNSLGEIAQIFNKKFVLNTLPNSSDPDFYIMAYVRM